MKKIIVFAVVALAAVLGSVLLAPSASAMVPPEPGSGASDSTAATSVAGLPVWQVVGIALVAVVIGAAGTFIAQRTYRHSQAGSVSMA